MPHLRDFPSDSPMIFVSRELPCAGGSDPGKITPSTTAEYAARDNARLLPQLFSKLCPGSAHSRAIATPLLSNLFLRSHANVLLLADEVSPSKCLVVHETCGDEWVRCTRPHRRQAQFTCWLFVARFSREQPRSTALKFSHEQLVD